MLSEQKEVRRLRRIWQRRSVSRPAGKMCGARPVNSGRRGRYAGRNSTQPGDERQASRCTGRASRQASRGIEASSKIRRGSIFRRCRPQFHALAVRQAKRLV